MHKAVFVSLMLGRKLTATQELTASQEICYIRKIRRRQNGSPSLFVVSLESGILLIDLNDRVNYQ